eukprot:CAMPEP_0185578626 /NCGR_PEP_ID=MMETSP0434-20130131/13049_1 /TAXON_ID=626734 ORGANISM="Favella taraikaensis, Strain Fe Narragansett Bay" /NCGR_SAMPLE_ID=MMETSP0434 /ASSEMBLY_ACC=CAM_ASM_000379 /LENGTH=56 /DNA_ID=CAMNT_0028196473 /DNA_START=146 /DNA_END=316 /DNA_ORIENTATION=+
MTFLIGPGYCRQVFKSVALDPIDKIEMIGEDDRQSSSEHEEDRGSQHSVNLLQSQL